MAVPENRQSYIEYEKLLNHCLIGMYIINKCYRTVLDVKNGYKQRCGSYLEIMDANLSKKSKNRKQIDEIFPNFPKFSICGPKKSPYPV